MRILRAIGRLLFLLVGSAVASLHFVWLCRRGVPTLAQRAAWLHGWCAFALPRLGIGLERRGQPQPGLVVANHLSYLDILVLSAAAPALFVAKSEVRGWPVFGWMARLAGTIFIRRERLRDLPRVIREMESALRSGATVVLFPEGTTSDGRSVLPFRSALFQAAVNAGAAVTPAHLQYSTEDGSAADEVCWWGDADFLPHLLRALGKPAIQAQVQFSSDSFRQGDRKQAAREARAEVLRMHSAVTSAAAQAETGAAAACELRLSW